MKSLNMNGPYKYDTDEMKLRVLEGKFGNYALGHKNMKKEFVVEYIGRSDTDLRRRLIQHVTDGEKYDYFKFSYAEDEVAAFEEECRNYHDFGENNMDNERHPKRPDGRDDLYCPYCDVFDDKD